MGPAGESGKAHSPIRTLWERGDERVRDFMLQFAAFADEGKQVILDRDWARLGELMNANFDLRRELYGDEVLGRQTLRLVEIAREHECPAKLPGSGGAVLGLAPEAPEDWRPLREAYGNEGYYARIAEIDASTQPLEGRPLPHG